MTERIHESLARVVVNDISHVVLMINRAGANTFQINMKQLTRSGLHETTNIRDWAVFVLHFKAYQAPRQLRKMDIYA